MARRRRRGGQFAPATKIVRVGAPRAAAPIIKVSAPRAPKIKRRRSGGRRNASGFGIGPDAAIQEAIGGAIYGFAVKSGWVQKLPAIPLIGRTGTAAILLHMWAKRGGGQMVRRAATAAAVIAGYQLGSTGAIMGDASTPGSMGDDAYSDGEDE